MTTSSQGIRTEDSSSLFAELLAHFAALGGVELDLPARSTASARPLAAGEG